MMKLLEPGDAPIRRHRLYEEVEQRLQKEIISGRLKAGEPMPSDRALMRPAIREALLSLQKKESASHRSGRAHACLAADCRCRRGRRFGSRKLDASEPRSVRDLQPARRFLECALARYAAARSSCLRRAPVAAQSSNVVVGLEMSSSCPK